MVLASPEAVESKLLIFALRRVGVRRSHRTPVTWRHFNQAGWTRALMPYGGVVFEAVQVLHFLTVYDDGACGLWAGFGCGDRMSAVAVSMHRMSRRGERVDPW